MSSYDCSLSCRDSSVWTLLSDSTRLYSNTSNTCETAVLSHRDVTIFPHEGIECACLNDRSPSQSPNKVVGQYSLHTLSFRHLRGSWTEELAQLQLRALAASEAILAGEKGPIYIGLASEDAFYRLVNGLNRTLHLSWESVDDSDMGRIYYFGDPSTTHQLLAAYACDVVSSDTTHNGVSGTQLGVITTELSIPAPTTRNPGAIRRRIKEPDASWLAEWVMLSTMQDRLSSVLEVAWHNESWTEFVREIEDLSLADHHVLGLKVQPAQTSRAQGSRSREMSLAFVARAARASTLRIWRFGDRAESQDARRAGVEVVEYAGDSIFLPACWFGYGDANQTKQVFLSLASLVEFASHAAQESGTHSDSGETAALTGSTAVSSKDVSLRLTNELRSTLHLSWDQAGESDIGEIYYFGDPSDPHQWLTAYVSETIAKDTSAQQCFGRQLGARTTELTIPSATSRNAGATRRRIKEPDGSWVPLAPRQSHRDPVLATVLEVAWLNESWTDFMREIHDWSMGGFHALGLKVRRPRGEPISADSMSLVFVTREAKASVMRIWRSGAQASRYDARLVHGVQVEERHDDVIDLPAAWFGRCLPSSSKKVALSLRSLLEEAVAAANLSDSAQVLGLDEECQSLSREVESIRARATLDGTNKATLV